MQEKIENFINALDKKVEVVIYKDDNSYKIVQQDNFQKDNLLKEFKEKSIELKKLTPSGLIYATYNNFPYIIEVKNIECKEELVFE